MGSIHRVFALKVKEFSSGLYQTWNMLVCIMSRLSSITSLIPPCTPELWPLNCPKTELAVSAHQVQYPASRNVVITIEFTTNKTGVFWVSLARLFNYILPGVFVC